MWLSVWVVMGRRWWGVNELGEMGMYEVWVGLMVMLWNVLGGMV